LKTTENIPARSGWACPGEFGPPPPPHKVVVPKVTTVVLATGGCPGTCSVVVVVAVVRLRLALAPGGEEADEGVVAAADGVNLRRTIIALN
jgi:hypothetical protein